MVLSICNTKPNFRQVIDSTTFGKSIILANQFEDTISFYIGIRKGKCWRVFAYDNQNALTYEDSLAFVQLNNYGRKEILIFDGSSYGSNGALGGNSTNWKGLKIIDLDSESILFDETIVLSDEIWSFNNYNNSLLNEEENEIKSAEDEDEEEIKTKSKYFECVSSISLNKGIMTISRSCNADSKDVDIPEEEKEEACNSCIESGVYQLISNKFKRIK